MPLEENTQSMVSKVLENFKSPSFLMYIAIVAIFVAIGYMIYINYIAPRISPSWIANDEYDQGKVDDPPEEGGSSSPSEKGQAQLYLFHTNWCPYCKKLWPIWDKVKADLDRKVFNGFQLSFVEIDGDKQEADLNYFEVEFLKSAEKKKIDGFPSIYMIKEDQVYEFEAAPTEDNLKEFVKSVL
jgi:thiol-disulfide isomerase/thioredoxin